MYYDGMVPPNSKYTTEDGTYAEAAEELDEFEEDLLRRCSKRLSELLPRRLRFSVSQANVGPAGVVAGAMRGSIARKLPLQVYVRVRPSCVQPQARGPSNDHAICITAAAPTQLRVQPCAKQSLRPAPTELYTFTQVLPEDSTQQQTYEATTTHMVSDLLRFRSQSSVIMAYGSSGAGKTFSIEGTVTEPGLLPRALHTIMQNLPSNVLAMASYFEVYGDAVYDLLAPCPAVNAFSSSSSSIPHSNNSSLLQGSYMAGTSHLPAIPEPCAAPARELGAANMQRPPKPALAKASKGAGMHGKMLRHTLLQHHDPPARNTLRVREDSSGQVVIPGLTVVPLSSAAHAVEVTLQEVAADGSVAGAAAGRTAKLSFVDLAGSERVGRTGNQGERFKESISINSSLMTLARCMEVLRVNQQLAAQQSQQQQQEHAGERQSAAANQPAAAMVGAHVAGTRRVPYRESKLTHIFRDVLHGQGALVLLVAVSPLPEDYEESSHVLRYAAAATGISCTVLPPPAPAHATMPAQSTVPTATTTTSAGNTAETDTQDTSQVDSTTATTAVTVTQADPAPLQERIVELETLLHNATVQLQDTQAALEEAEADIREDVMAEVSNVIQELRESYEAQLSDMQSQLQAKDDELQQLRALLAVEQGRRHQDRAGLGESAAVHEAAKLQQGCQLQPAQAADVAVMQPLQQDIEATCTLTSAHRPLVCDAQEQLQGTCTTVGGDVVAGRQVQGVNEGAQALQPEVLAARDENVQDTAVEVLKGRARQHGKRQRAAHNTLTGEHSQEHDAGLRRSKRRARCS